MENDKAWERRSDEWIQSMDESKLLKEQRLHKKLIANEAKKDTQYPARASYAGKKPG